MNIELSAFYFDIRKDALYCDPISSVKRRAALTVLDKLFDHLVVWLAPGPELHHRGSLARTPSEARMLRSISRLFPEVPDELGRTKSSRPNGRKIRKVRRVVTGALEIERREKTIGSSLEAAPEGLYRRRRSRTSRCTARISPKSASPRTSRSSRTKARPKPSGSTRSPASRWSSPVPRASAAPARGRSRPMSAPIPTIPTSARATPRPCASVRRRGSDA